MKLTEYAIAIGASFRITGEIDPRTKNVWVNVNLVKNCTSADIRTRGGFLSAFGRSNTGDIQEAMEVLAERLSEQTIVFSTNGTEIYDAPELEHDPADLPQALTV